MMDLISRGDLKPGQRLPSERELCQNFGASRSSLREALRCLSIVGVLNARVGEGTSVALDGEKFLGKVMEWRLITEKHDIENLLEARMALEGLSASNAALRASDEEIAKVEEILGRMEAVLKDEKKFAVLDLSFHVTLARISGNALVFDLVSMIRSQLARALANVLMFPDALALSHKEHSAVVAAIKGRDPEAAALAMQSHLKAALERYRKYGVPAAKSHR